MSAENGGPDQDELTQDWVNRMLPEDWDDFLFDSTLQQGDISPVTGVPIDFNDKSTYSPDLPESGGE